MRRILIVGVILFLGAAASAKPAPDLKMCKSIADRILSSVSSGLSLKLYGNYCGPNYGDLSYQTPAIDKLDQACLDHDRCYDSGHHGLQQSCACDFKMYNDIEKAVDEEESLSGEAILAAVGMQMWFKRAPCVCRVSETQLRDLAKPNLKDKEKCQFEVGSPYDSER